MGRAGGLSAALTFLLTYPLPPPTPSATSASSCGHCGRSGARESKLLSPQACRPWEAERASARTPPTEPPSWPAVPSARCLGSGSPAEGALCQHWPPRPAGVGFLGPTPIGCLPTGDRSALGRGSGDSDRDTGAWLIFGSETGLAPALGGQQSRCCLGKGVPSCGGRGQQAGRAELLGDWNRARRSSRPYLAVGQPCPGT